MQEYLVASLGSEVVKDLSDFELDCIAEQLVLSRSHDAEIDTLEVRGEFLSRTAGSVGVAAIYYLFLGFLLPNPNPISPLDWAFWFATPFHPFGWFLLFFAFLFAKAGVTTYRSRSRRLFSHAIVLMAELKSSRPSK